MYSTIRPIVLHITRNFIRSFHDLSVYEESVGAPFAQTIRYVIFWYGVFSICILSLLFILSHRFFSLSFAALPDTFLLEYENAQIKTTDLALPHTVSLAPSIQITIDSEKTTITSPHATTSYAYADLIKTSSLEKVRFTKQELQAESTSFSIAILLAAAIFFVVIYGTHMVTVLIFALFAQLLGSVFRFRFPYLRMLRFVLFASVPAEIISIVTSIAYQDLGLGMFDITLAAIILMNLWSFRKKTDLYLLEKKNQ